MGKLEGKVAVVTGAANGIGQATAELMASEGARVVVADLDETGAKAVADGIVSRGGQAVACRTDVSDEDSIAEMVATAVRSFGGLHVLHNNAANTARAFTVGDVPVVQADLHYWDAAFAVNVRGVMLGCKHAIPHMIEAGGGSIVNTSSGSSLAGDIGSPAYGVTKAGVNLLTMHVATEYGLQRIRCNAVAPGMVWNQRHQASTPSTIRDLVARQSVLGRAAQPSEIASVVTFLASDEASYVTGQVISVDGGHFAHQPYVADLRDAFGGRPMMSDPS